MASPVLITVDTELTWRHYAPGADWRDNFERSIEPAGVGLTWQLDRLARHGLKASFFVDPMPATIYGIEPIARIVAPILAAGQEVQLHLHPQWHEAARGRRDPQGVEIGTYAAGDQLRLIGLGRALLIEAGAPPPIAFRGGSYAANADTLKALADLGFLYDSSHNGSHHPWPSDLPLPPRQIAPVEAGGLTEIPVTQIEGPSGGLRHLQICAVSRAEIEAALAYAAANRHPLTTIVSHSFELATRDGRRANKLLRGRFEALCAFLERNRERHPTHHFGTLGEVPLGAEAVPMPARRARTARRFVEQIWSSTRYERPAEAATATAGGSIHGVELLLPIIGL